MGSNIKAMKEDFLHYIWQFKKFDFLRAKTTEDQEIVLLESGTHNQHYAGPDFFNAKIRIGGQLWAGNVEIHLKSSDWYAHHHETDPAYDNVILHVVWEHDVEVYRKNSKPLPTLILKELIYKNTWANYKNLLLNNEGRWINCERDFPDFSNFELGNWLERLFIERLEQKSKVINDLLREKTNDWEAVLFCLLAKNFGLNMNGEAFLQMAKSIPFSVIQKIGEVRQMEALLFGQSGMLEKEEESPYYRALQAEYHFLKHKFKLSSTGVKVNYFRLRPPNFPTIRLAQLASLLVQNRKLFSVLLGKKELEEIHNTFQVQLSEFWKTHYTFGKESKAREKKLTTDFINLIIINTWVPLRFCYAKYLGQEDFEALLKLMRQIPAEENAIIRNFDKLRSRVAKDGLASQALLQLKKEYCDKNRCLACALGLKLLNRS